MADHTEEQLREAERQIRKEIGNAVDIIRLTSDYESIAGIIPFLIRKQAALIEAEKEIARLKEKLNSERERCASAWPPIDVITKLCEAVNILLHEKDYDGHGWEELQLALDLAKQWLIKEQGIRKEDK